MKQKYIKLSFSNQTDLIKVRREILKAVRKNKQKENVNSYYMEILSSALANNSEDVSVASNSKVDQLENIMDIR